MDNNQLCERSIIKRFRAEIWRKFTSALNEYRLIEEGDNIAVCISGGKDSFLMAKCMQEIQRHGRFDFNLKFIVMNPGYSEKNLNQIIENATALSIPLHVFKTQIFDIVKDAGGSPCYLCARMRRGYLYKEAQELGCNKIALGHHMDDVIGTVLLSMFYGAEVKTMLPKLRSANFAGMTLIRPLYKVKECDIISWARYNDLSFLQCACRFTEQIAMGDGEISSKRNEVKQLIASLKEVNPDIDTNIFRSIHNVNIDAVTGYRKDGKLHSFLERFEDE